MTESSEVLSTMPIPTVPAAGVVSVGVLILVPQPWADELRAARHAVGDPQADLVPPHITLLPPTAVPTRAMPRIRHHLVVAGGHLPVFRVGLRGTGSFRPVSPVVFVRLDEGGQDCDRLQQVINQGILQRPLFFDYHPHVTLGQGLSDERLNELSDKMGSFSASFVVRRFALFRYDSAGRWEIDTTIVLGTDPAHEGHRV